MLYQLPKVKELYLYKNQFTGTILDFKLTSLTTQIRLSHNRLNGPKPESFVSCFHLQNTNLFGGIPESISSPFLKELVAGCGGED